MMYLSDFQENVVINWATSLVSNTKKGATQEAEVSNKVHELTTVIKTDFAFNVNNTLLFFLFLFYTTVSIRDYLMSVSLQQL